jgi:DNA ligase D-like protein (predicted ligase)
MLCTLLKIPPTGEDWIFEPKYDGLRVLAHFDGRAVTLLSRNDNSQNVAFPDIVESLKNAFRHRVIVDGEVVCLDAHGHSSFRALQQRFHIQNADEARSRAQRHPAYVYLFDILYIDKYDVRKLPLEDRKQLLESAVVWSDRVRWTPPLKGDGESNLRKACGEGREGIIGKLRASPYVGARGAGWVKIKCTGRQEFVIGGFTEPHASRVGLGAILVGYYDADGKTLHYAGKVGTGFTNEMLRDLQRQLESERRPTSPFVDLAERQGVHWVEPKLVAEVAFTEWTQHGALRHPRFEGMRTDKSPRECRRELAQSTAVDKPRRQRRN